ncbi:MAG: electron transport complex subunit RsxA, partial [Candidatus Izimaplasma sp.]|nr:electron transport complex subunit RsxA [Candidatus Izimaplasma bacterium]
MELIAIAFGAIFVNNVVLNQFYGLCPFLGVSTKKSSALSMGMAVTFVIT